MIAFTEQQIRNFARQEIDSNAKKAQYSVTKVPYHAHNGVDSPMILDTDVSGGKVYATITVGASDSLNASADAYDYFCDGTDDDVEINAAIAALPTVGGRILLSEGTFNIGATIAIAKSNFILEGNGAATKIFLENSKNVDVISLGDGTNSYSNVELKNFKIDGNSANQSFGEGIDGFHGKITNLLIENCVVTNTYGINIDVENTSKNVRIINNTCDTTRASGQPNIYIYKVDDFIIAGNSLKNSTYHAIQIQEAGSGDVVNNNISLYGEGRNAISLEGTGAYIVYGNIILGVDNNGINISSVGSAIVIGNAVNLSGTNDTLNGINVSVEGNFTIGNNTVRLDGTSGGTAISGAKDTDGVKVIADNTIYLNFSSTTGTGVLLDEDSVVIGNIIESASAGCTIKGIEYNTSSGRVAILDNYMSKPEIGITTDNKPILDSIISNNYLRGQADGGAEGFLLGSTSSTTLSINNAINGNHIVNVAKEGIKMIGLSYSSICGNNIANVGQATNDTYAAILLSTGATGKTSAYNTITGNVIRSDASNKQKYGIRENTSSDSPTIVSSNIVLDSVTTAISLQGGSSINANNITV